MTVDHLPVSNTVLLAHLQISLNIIFFYLHVLATNTGDKGSYTVMQVTLASISQRKLIWTIGVHIPYSRKVWRALN